MTKSEQLEKQKHKLRIDILTLEDMILAKRLEEDQLISELRRQKRELQKLEYKTLDGTYKTRYKADLVATKAWMPEEGCTIESGFAGGEPISNGVVQDDNWADPDWKEMKK